ncbi:aminodeoxychorismate lyase [Diutina catenulata]
MNFDDLDWKSCPEYDEQTFQQFKQDYAQELKQLEQMYSAPAVDDAFRIFSSMRFEPRGDEITAANFFLFDLHYTRLLFSLQYFAHEEEMETEVQFTREAFLDGCTRSVSKSLSESPGPFRLRVSLSLHGEMKVEVFDTPAVKDLLWGLNPGAEPVWDVYLDARPILASPFTSFKTTRREHYNQARSRALPGKKPEEEVVVWNGQGQVMEGSITNMAVWVGSQWVTPTLASGCLCGVTRAYLLEKGLIKEGPIIVSQLEKDQLVLLFNAVRGVFLGRFVVVPEIKQFSEW